MTTRSKKEMQLHLEELFDKHKLMPALRNHFSKGVYEGAIQEMTDKYPELTPRFITEVLVQIQLHKQCPPAVMVGTLKSQWKDTASQEIANWLEILVNEGVLLHQGNRLVVKFGLPEEFQRAVDTLQFPMPMAVEPLQVKENSETGYLTTKGSLLLGNAHHNNDINLEHINTQNKIKFTLNMDTVVNGINKWANLDAPKSDETTEKYESRCRAFTRFKERSEQLHDLVDAIDNEFYITNKYDSRGRCYSVGYLVNPQGHDFNKAIIEFNNKEIVEI